jgi:hypothetical protein
MTNDEGSKSKKNIRQLNSEKKIYKLRIFRNWIFFVPCSKFAAGLLN